MLSRCVEPCLHVAYTGVASGTPVPLISNLPFVKYKVLVKTVCLLQHTLRRDGLAGLSMRAGDTWNPASSP